MMKKMKNKGITLFESLAAITVSSVAVLGLIQGSVEYTKYVNEKAIIKDVTSILRAVDTRVSIDGYSYSYWPSQSSVSGHAAVFNYIQEAFIAKGNQECGQSNGWVPQLESEKEKNFIACNTWEESLPYNSNIKIETFENSQGFLNTFNLYIELKDANADTEENRYKQNKSILTQLEKNDFSNKNGFNQYSFVNKTNDEKLTNIECSRAGNDCVIKTSWSKGGFSENLRVNGTNSMISSNVSFKTEKITGEEITCEVWVETSPNIWTPETVDCGIGVYSYPDPVAPSTAVVSVHLNVNDLRSEIVILDRKCNNYQQETVDGGVIILPEKVLCGLINDGEVVMYGDALESTELSVSDDLYANSIENVEFIEVANNLKNNYIGSNAHINTLDVNEEALFKGTVEFLENLIIRDIDQANDSINLSVSDLNLFSLQVNQFATLSNVTIDDGDDSINTTKKNITITNENSDITNEVDLNADFYISNAEAEIGMECDFVGSVTVQKETGTVLNCKQDWRNTSKSTWQSNYYGEIATFYQESCPSGWNEIEDVHSRFMIGSGSYNELFMPIKTYRSGDKGGEAAVQLTLNQLPEHSHGTPNLEHICDTCHRNVKEEDCKAPYTWFPNIGPNGCVSSQGLSKTKEGTSVFTNDSERKSSEVGGDKAHNNLPDYFAITYCVYAEGDQQTPDLNNPAPLEPDWIPYKDEISNWQDDTNKKFYSCTNTRTEYSPEEDEYYTMSDCKLDQYRYIKGREIDQNSGNVRYSGVVNYEYKTIDATEIWKEIEPDYTEWENVREPYNCTPETVFFDGEDYFKTKDCSQDQERSKQRREKEIRFGDIRNLGSIETELQVITVTITRIVASGGFDGVNPKDLEITEGAAGTTIKLSVDIRLNKPFSEEVIYRVNTQDITTTSILSETENLIYDEYGNPFISVVDNQNGGKLMFDGGFPKYYNTYWNNSTKFSTLPNQFKFMHNVIKWMSETRSERGQVLLYGDAVQGHDYSVHEGASSDFNQSIPGAISIAGYTPVIKTALDYGGNRSTGVPASLSLDEMNKYSSIVIMSSGGWNSFTNETANNFTTYVNNGGGIYIITDHAYFQATGNQVLRKFGSEFYGTVNRHSDNNAYKLSTIWKTLSGSKYGKGHQLWNGLNASGSIHAGWSEGNVKLFTPVQDYIGLTKDLVFAPGETLKTIEITINGDDLAEIDETFKIILSSPDTGIIVGSSELIVTIVDDDSGVKSLSMYCDPNLQLLSGSCVGTMSSALSIVETEETLEVEAVEGVVKTRYDESGNVFINTIINGHSFTEQCNKNSIMNIVNNTEDTKKLSENIKEKIYISNYKTLSAESWNSYYSFADDFSDSGTNCLDLESGFDYNIKFKADVTKTIISDSISCESGVLKNGQCLESITEAPTQICLGDYVKIDDSCIKR